jgi:hypothetical protein
MIRGLDFPTPAYMRIRTVVITGLLSALAVSAAFFAYRWNESRLFQADLKEFGNLVSKVTDPSQCGTLRDADFRTKCEDNARSNHAIDDKNPSECSGISDSDFRAACMRTAAVAVGNSSASADACQKVPENVRDLCSDAFKINAGLGNAGFDCSKLSTEAMKRRCETLLSSSK